MKNTYLGSNEQLRQENINARQFTLRYNSMDPSDVEGHFQALKGFLGDIGEKSRILAPFACDRGNKIHIGKGSFVNYGATFLDILISISATTYALRPTVRFIRFGIR